MRILYDKAPSDCLYPLTIEDVQMAMKYVEPEITGKISSIRFCLNPKSAREGTVKKNGNKYHIVVNFCLRNFQTNILNIKNKKYLCRIKEYGGELSLKSKKINWSLPNAQLYAFDVLFHEIGHITYDEDFLGDCTIKEENWCDKYSTKLIKKLRENLKET